MYDVLIIGGGAAGFYTAIHIAEALPGLKIAILERGKEVLTKVKISGGGRCNVTHAEFDPKALATNYPRGEKELLGPFHTYASGDTVHFFEKRGISLKIEDDGRMFPASNSSQTIIDCFLSETKRLGIAVLTKCPVVGLASIPSESGSRWQLTTTNGLLDTRYVVLATGSNPKMWDLMRQLGHEIVPPVPSLFTFNIADARISNIPGLSTMAEVTVLDNGKPKPFLKSKVVKESVLSSEGPVLITHWGMSGPAILKLSAWGARILNAYDYRFAIAVNWAPEYHQTGLLALFMKIKEVERKTVLRTKVLEVPKRLWKNLVLAAGISETATWPDVSKQQLQQLAEQLTHCVFEVNGKSAFKEEFVTAGGVALKEVNFKTYESKLLPRLFFAGEIIDVDAITGGFNFQNAWTGGFLAAQGIVQSVLNKD